MSDEEWLEFSEYQLLIRVLNEQEQTDADGTVKPTPKNEISPVSFQNPSDPDATYRKKAGKDHKGYVANIIETVGEDGISLITGAGYENNTHSDSSFCKEYLGTRSTDSPDEIVITEHVSCLCILQFYRYQCKAFFRYEEGGPPLTRINTLYMVFEEESPTLTAISETDRSLFSNSSTAVSMRRAER